MDFEDSPISFDLGFEIIQKVVPASAVPVAPV